MSAIRVTVQGVQGSAPREEGAAMLVFADHIAGTIGGGALEWEAMRHARQMLADGAQFTRRQFPLGPALGQCCGGAVTLAFEAAEDLPQPAARPLWVWGAGHVGRAIVATMSPLPTFAVSWVDVRADRFPSEVPSGVETLVATEPARLMRHAPVTAHHLIVTFSHDIDLELCHAALSRGFASCGLIGSATKWARFQRRLQQLGHSHDEISCIVCPIGDPTLGKHPQAIAIGVSARLIDAQMLKESAKMFRTGIG